MSGTPVTCLDEYDPSALSIDEARDKVLLYTPEATRAQHASLHAAIGEVLSEDVAAAIDVPCARNSAMDGYAVRGCDLPESGDKAFKVIGKAMAGHPFNIPVGKNEAVRIMTGANVPDGADTIIMQEHARVDDEQITIGDQHTAGQFVRHPGEDMRAGEPLLSQGRTLMPADLGLLASQGIAHVSVYQKPRIAFFSTGDELASIGEELKEGQIYDSNRYTLYGMLTRLGMEVLDLGIIPDERYAIREAFVTAHDHADVIITTGGVSVGEADYIREIVTDLGEINFWKIAMKPGRPLTMGKVKDVLFFGLPGNPVSTMVTFYQFVQPALMKMRGKPATAPQTITARCTTPLKKIPGRVEFQRGVIENIDGQWEVRSAGGQGSHILSGMSRANCFIQLDINSQGADVGDIVTVQPFAEMI